MKRKLNTLELRRLREGGGDQQHEQQQQGSSPSKKPRTPGKGSPKRAVAARSTRLHGSRKEDPREHQDLNREEIALMCMEVSEKIDRCFDFDLQKWLDRYEGLRAKEETNFPEAAMLIMSAAQIYGRKVDYLEDIILHMDQDQKGREESMREDQEGHPAEGDGNQVGKTGRKRAARFQPQSLSDCFSDFEFSFVDKKIAPIGSLVGQVERVAVDRRNKFQQMQELCNELRMMPSKQRRQEILNRLRDEANIPPILSSHTAARKNQILDLESGETIGTRYDYQIYLNFIDVKTGSLMPEHDLKRFFQRCDVIDYLFEQHEYERERCEKAGQPAPDNVFPLRPREFKIYMPPDYLQNKYRIKVGDTADFDNELHKAKSSNYRTDPILELMQSKFADRSSEAAARMLAEEDVSFSNVLSSSVVEAAGTVPAENPSSESNETGNDSGHQDDSGHFDDSQTTEPMEESSSQEQDASLNISQEDPQRASEDQLPKSKESSPEPELMALENLTLPEDPNKSSPEKQPEDPQCQSRLSLEDEGIGADRESLAGKMTPTSDLPRTPSLDKLNEVTAPIFGAGTVIPTATMGVVPSRTINLKPSLLELNVLKIPECHLRKHLLFALPPEYKRMKMDLVRRTSGDRGKDLFTLDLYSLNPRAARNSEWQKRPSTPEPEEDFHGFDEYEDLLNGPYGKCLYSLAPISEGQRSNFSRASSPEGDFFGFENEEDPPEKGLAAEPELAVAEQPKNSGESNPENPPKVSEDEQNGDARPSEAEPGPEKSPSQQSTPSRTMSRDSGISDDQHTDRDRASRSSQESSPEAAATAPLDSVPEDDVPEGEDDVESALTSAKYIQSVAEAKEMIEKVNAWHRKLKPILIQSEKRNHFDIHAYGTEIIDSFEEGESPPVVNFEQVMEDKPGDYTARYFLSMLMLANTNNVQIVAQNQDSQRLTEKGDIQLRLLSRKRHHQEMESMGERIPCDNTPSGKGISGRSPRGKKRKRLVTDEGEDEGMDEGEYGLSGIRRLHDESGDDEADLDFLEKIRRMYPDINGEETVRKRIAFHRGMRRCAYGLNVVEEEPPDGTNADTSQRPPEEPSSQPNSTEEPDDTDEILSVDLQTNEAVMLPVPMMVDPDPCCSKSIYSTAESGYESMIGTSDC